MGFARWLKSLFASGSIGVDNPEVAKLIAALASQVTITSPGNNQIRRLESTVATAEELGELQRQYPKSAELHYAYAAALQLNLLGEKALKVLRECVKAHPGFWISDLTLKRNSLSIWNPFLCPEFDPGKTEVVHSAFNSILSRTLLLSTRRGVLPRAVIFHRDGNDELAVSKLGGCKIEFITTVSSVKDPQVVAINACIHDDPRNPFRTEILACPFGPWSDQHRFTYEIFVRQDDFDFVIVDGRGRVKYTRLMTPSSRMKSAHSNLAQMFDRTEGREIPESAVVQAIRRHTGSVDPNRIVY